jgi:hypothetical protein
MTDLREEILSRMMEILGSQQAVVDGDPAPFATIARNRSELMEVSRPALILLDGDEQVTDEMIPRGKGFAVARPVVMVPEVTIILGGREPQNINIGEDLNAMRVAVIKAIAIDATLTSLLGTNGDLQYGGLVTDLGWTRSLEGVMVLSFLITYWLHIGRL